MAVNFPGSPNTGDTYSAGNRTFRYDGTRWVPQAKLNDYVGNVDIDANISGNAFTNTLGTISGSATLDLSTGNSFDYTPTANTTFVFSNPPASGTAYEFDLKINGAVVASSYDLANASYDNKTLTLDTGAGNGLAIKPDGTKIYILYAFDGVSSIIDEYELSTPFDISTASGTGSSATITSGAVSTTVQTLFFKPDGTRLYIGDNITNFIHQYDLSTAWDLSTISYSNVELGWGSNGYSYGLTFKPDGTEMYVADPVYNSIYQTTLNTAWDLSGGASATYSQSLTGTGYRTRAVEFNADGSKMFIWSADGPNDIFEYELTTPWRVNTATTTNFLYDFSAETGATDDKFSEAILANSGTKMYILSDTNLKIYQYTTATSTPATFTYPASVKWPNNTTPDIPVEGESKVFSFYTDTGGAEYIAYEKFYKELVPVSASGGTESTYTANGTTYKQHVFTSDGTITVTAPGTVEILVVGGGGGGGMLGGGGGGGGVVVASNTVENGSYAVVVGDGGSPQLGWSTATGSVATKGGSSSVFGVTAYGGGGARSYSNGGQNVENQGVANYGGLGRSMTYAGVSASFAANDLPSGWTGTVHAGFVGGTSPSNCCPCNGGGGGGAGQAGTNNTGVNDTTNKPNGGDGVIPILNGVPLYSGQNYYFGGGGGADAYCNSGAGIPGKGGAGGSGDDNSGQETAGDTNGINNGGNGNPNGNSATGTSGWGGDGGANTGGGGGAGSNGNGNTNVRGGTGGSGIVVVRYAI
jgi:hypothetical protein